MALKVQVSELINQAVDVVFHFYANDHIRNHPRWDPDMELEQISAGPIGVGTIIRRRNSRSGTPVEGTMEVVEFEPNRAMGVISHDGNAEIRGRVTFEAINQDQTAITIFAEFLDVDDSTDPTFITGLMERSARNIRQLIEAEISAD